MEHCHCAVVGTIEWVDKSRTEDIVQIDVGQLRGVGWGGRNGGKCVGCVHNVHFLGLNSPY